MAYNPLRLRLNHRGQMVDKYDRVFTYDPEKFKKVRRKHPKQQLTSKERVWPSYHAHKNVLTTG